MRLHRVQRRYIMILEVMIAFVLIVFCALPLIYPHVFILRSEKQFVSSVELDHFVNLLFVEFLQKLYQNEIPWSVIESEKTMPIDEAMLRSLGYENKLPFIGTYRFEEKKHKTSADKDHSVYLEKLIFKFTPKKGMFVTNPSEDLSYQYEYEIVVEQRGK